MTATSNCVTNNIQLRLVLVFFLIYFLNVSVGYTIPKYADVHINTLALHNDSTVYSNPNHFDPNNFLCPDGTVLRPQSFFSFGAGRRACPGENLAKNIMFLTVTSLLQKFQFLPVPQVDYRVGQSEVIEVCALSQSYEVLIKLRENK